MRVPPPEYITDKVTGAIYPLPSDAPQEFILVVGDIPEVLHGLPVTLQGELIVRYAIPFAAPSPDAMVPGLFVGEKGGTLTGREAWDFMQAKFQIYPRADVVGIRSNGMQDQVFLRELDFGLRVKVFVYTDVESRLPIETITGLFKGAHTPELPDLLSKYLPEIDSLAALVKPPL